MGHEKRRYFNLNKRYQILLSKGKKCENCLQEIKVIEKNNRRYCIYELDHIVPLSRNGPDCEENLCVLCLECHRIKFLNEILSPNEQRYCLRHDTYYNNDNHGASCFRDKDQVAPVVRTIESFKFSGTSSPEPAVVPSQVRARAQAVAGTPVDKDQRTWAQAVSSCLP